jgi:hypothetical protein
MLTLVDTNSGPPTLSDSVTWLFRPILNDSPTSRLSETDIADPYLATSPTETISLRYASEVTVKLPDTHNDSDTLPEAPITRLCSKETLEPVASVPADDRKALINAFPRTLKPVFPTTAPPSDTCDPTIVSSRTERLPEIN